MFIQRLTVRMHRATIAEANLDYARSITIDEALLDAANIQDGALVQVVNINNGERLETDVIPGKRGSGTVCLNGAAARKAQVGDIVIIISYAFMTPEEAKEFSPTTIFPDHQNQLS